MAIAACAGCGQPQTEVSEAPIPLGLVGGDGGLLAFGTFAAQGETAGAPLPLLVDTGSVYSTRAIADGTGAKEQIRTETLRLFDVPASGAGDPVARASFDDVLILDAPLAPVGIADRVLALGGVLAGDLLQRFSIELSYANGAGSIALQKADPACSCAVADTCAATFPFTLAGGGTLMFGDRVQLYPPTRVTLDACLEPASDPLGRGVACIIRDVGGRTRHAPGYEPDQPPGTGADVRLLVATGFPGVLIGAGAWDRLHGKGEARKLLQAGPFVELHLTRDTAPFRVVRVSLGDESGCDTGGNCSAALAIVGREGLLGPCGELARSRRIRYRASHPDDPLAGIGFGPACPSTFSGPGCPLQGASSCLVCLSGSACGAPDRCNDRDQPAAPYVELGGGLPVFLADDIAPLLQEGNLDVRPLLSDIEGVVGTDLLARLETRIDYPNNRVIARCAAGSPTSGAGACATFPRFACAGQVNDCGLRGMESDRVCNPPSSIPLYDRAKGSQCLRAPNL